MFSHFVMFLAGVFTLRILQFALSVTPNYYIFKHAEYTVFRMLAELHVQKLAVMKIVELCYHETERSNEYYNVETAVNKRYNDIINKYIQNLKTLLPYKTKYNNLNEAIEQFARENRNG